MTHACPQPEGSWSPLTPNPHHDAYDIELSTLPTLRDPGDPDWLQLLRDDAVVVASFMTVPSIIVAVNDIELAAADALRLLHDDYDLSDPADEARALVECAVAIAAELHRRERLVDRIVANNASIRDVAATRLGLTLLRQTNAVGALQLVLDHATHIVRADRAYVEANAILATATTEYERRIYAPAVASAENGLERLTAFLSIRFGRIDPSSDALPMYRGAFEGLINRAVAVAERLRELNDDA